MNLERLQHLNKVYSEFPKAELGKQLQLDFKEYCRWMHFVSSGTEMDLDPVHLKIIKALQDRNDAIMLGKEVKRNLMINCPPGTGKSLLIQYYITWCFARNKYSTFCYVAASDLLMKKLSRESRDLMMTPDWESLFGKEMDPNDKSAKNYHLISGGNKSGLTAGSVESSMLGLNAGNPASPVPYSGDLILDDINKVDVVNSVHEQIGVPDVYQRKFMTRRRTPVTGTIAVMQRHHVNDFAGWVEREDNDDWDWVIVPALDEGGESFYPKRYPKHQLERIQKQNPFLFAAMYQQVPLTNYGNYFKEEWIRTYSKNVEDFKKLFITTDFGFTSGGDNTVCVCWGLGKDGNLYQLRSLAGRWETPLMKKNFVDFFARCRAAFPACRRVYIERVVASLGMIQSMKVEQPVMAICELKRGAKKSKMNRAESALTWLEAGRVYFRENDPLFVRFRSELLAWDPGDKNPKDDLVDNLGDACEIAFNEGVGSINI